MSLRSALFSGDRELEAAAVSNSAHIVPGAAGAHVGKIQRALNILDGANLSEDGVYGPATAAAVLRYKQRRKIINLSYQTEADNIVGILTMAALDDELLSRIDSTVIIGSAVFFVPPATPNIFRGLAVAGSTTAPTVPTANIRSVIRGNPYVPLAAPVQAGMPASLPPTKTYAVQVTVEPPLTGSDFIELSIIGSSVLNGSATVSPSRITKTTTVVVTGGSQTLPRNAGRLQIQAKLNGNDVKAVSDGFSVCAHPLNLKTKFFRDINAGQAGMIVAETLDSDSGRFADLDQVQWSEVVEPLTRNEPPFNQGSGIINNSAFLPVIPPPGKFISDTHAEPRPSAGPKGIVDKIQLHIFNCARCGAIDKAVPNSGFDIEHEVFPAGNRFKHKVTKSATDISIILPSNRGTVKTKAGLGNVRSPDHDLP